MLFLLQLPIMLELAPPSPFAYFPASEASFLFLVHALKPKFGNTFANIYFNLSFYSKSCLVTQFIVFLSPVNCGCLTVQEREKVNLQRAVGE